MVDVKVDDERWDGCGTCGNICPLNVFEIEEKKRHVAYSNEWFVCRACEVQCSNGSTEIVE